MLSKKTSKKRIWMTIIIIFLIFSFVNFGATKIIYDSFFPRYNCTISSYPTQLEEMINNRETVSFDSGENTLCGYLYKSSTSDKKDALIVLASGHNACSDCYLWQIKELSDCGWSVFAYDSTGCCNSEGKSSIGFSQELLDLTSALDYIENNNRFGYNNIALLGHSRGGYAVCCALKYNYDITAVISVSGINSAMEAVIGASYAHTGPLAYLNYGYLWLYQATLFDTDTLNVRANEVLKNTDTPVLVIHGADDKKVPTDKFSVYSYKDDFDSENIEYLLRFAPDTSGHTDILFDKDSTANNSLIQIIDTFLEKKLK